MYEFGQHAPVTLVYNQHPRTLRDDGFEGHRTKTKRGGGEFMSPDHSAVSELPSAEDLAALDEDVLVQAVRRYHSESNEATDPIAAFGAFNQHGSSPW